ncbi:MAG: cytochrome b/b6 domain-containing protein [Burkholderiales bacterium]|nr:cytochrome b/b6 domain-containing protein [Burkholderiales bacterium]
MRVWDPLLRFIHWSLALFVTLSWFTQTGGRFWHEVFGYATLALAALRVVWGFTGPRYARFTQFVRGPRQTLAYAGAVLRRTEPRHLGHNPLGAWMILALLAAIALVDASGWLYTTDRYWGVEWVEDLHDALAYVLLALVALHLAGVAFTSWRQRENLVAAMIHGRKRPPSAPEAG